MAQKPRNGEDPSRGLFSDGTPGPEGSRYVPEKIHPHNHVPDNDLDADASTDVTPPPAPWDVLMVPPAPNNKPRGLWRTLGVAAASSLTAVVVAWLASRTVGTGPGEFETFEAPVIEATAPAMLSAPVAAARKLADEIPSAFEPSGRPDLVPARAEAELVRRASPNAIAGTTGPSPISEDRARVTVQVIGSALPLVAEDDAMEGVDTEEDPDPKADKADKEGNRRGSGGQETGL